MKILWTFCCVALAQICAAQNSNRREAVINEWIRTIREAPKGHSISPSWSSKSRIPVIGVGGLPLQNEGEISSARLGVYQQQQPQQQPASFQSQGMPDNKTSILEFENNTSRSFVKPLQRLFSFNFTIASSASPIRSIQ